MGRVQLPIVVVAAVLCGMPPCQQLLRAAQRHHGVGCQAQHNARRDAGSEGHHEDAEEGRERMVEIIPLDLAHGAHHEAADEDKSGSTCTHGHVPEQGHKEAREQEEHTSDHGGQPSARALLDSGGTLQEDDAGAATEHGAHHARQAHARVGHLPGTARQQLGIFDCCRLLVARCWQHYLPRLRQIDSLGDPEEDAANIENSDEEHRSELWGIGS
mmetsp:Transcript_124495/g.265375  ORF Transcript_124495/g.265375 Transcript_124495/m.265375 type:complete len:215 (+) Transcript_124495:424-1068(+)